MKTSHGLPSVCRLIVATVCCVAGADVGHAADQTLSGHTGSTTGLDWHPNGKVLACGCFDKTIGIWDIKSGKRQRTLTGHTQFVYCVAWNRDGTQLASASYDKTVRVWDAKTGRETHKFVGHTAPVLGVAWSPDLSLIHI